jgi:hypothetical protein
MKRSALKRAPTGKIVVVRTDDPDSASAVILGEEEIWKRSDTAASNALASRWLVTRKMGGRMVVGRSVRSSSVGMR